MITTIWDDSLKQVWWRGVTTFWYRCDIWEFPVSRDLPKWQWSIKLLGEGGDDGCGCIPKHGTRDTIKARWCFLSQAMQRRRKMAHTVLIKAFLQPSPEATTLFIPFRYTHLLLSHPFLLVQSQGCCQKWHHKLNFCQLQLKSLVVNQLGVKRQSLPLVSRSQLQCSPKREKNAHKATKWIAIVFEWVVTSTLGDLTRRWASAVKCCWFAWKSSWESRTILN